MVSDLHVLTEKYLLFVCVCFGGAFFVSPPLPAAPSFLVQRPLTNVLLPSCRDVMTSIVPLVRLPPTPPPPVPLTASHIVPPSYSCPSLFLFGLVVPVVVQRIEGYYGPVYENFALRDPVLATAVEV